MQKIIILDFGSQTTQLIGRRVREMDTFCEILPYNKFPFGDPDVIGVILSGSPLSVYASDAFRPDLTGILGKYPVLGICYGAQYLSWSHGGKVEPVGTREYGRASLSVLGKLPASRRHAINMAKVEAMYGKIRRFLLRIQISSPFAKLDGGWMRAYDMQLDEYYGLDLDMDWGAYCIMGGWVMSFIPLVFLYEGTPESFFVTP